jgi:hypothetical protein
MRKKKVGAIAIKSFVLLVVLGTAYLAKAQDAKTAAGIGAPFSRETACRIEIKNSSPLPSIFSMGDDYR